MRRTNNKADAHAAERWQRREAARLERPRGKRRRRHVERDPILRALDAAARPVVQPVEEPFVWQFMNSR